MINTKTEHEKTRSVSDLLAVLPLHGRPVLADRCRTAGNAPASHREQARSAGGEPYLPVSVHPSARHITLSQGKHRAGLCARTRLPGHSRSRGDGQGREGQPDGNPHHLPLRQEQETHRPTTGADGYPHLRHPGCRGPLLHVHQHPLLCHAELCRTGKKAHCAGSPQPVRLCGRPAPASQVQEFRQPVAHPYPPRVHDGRTGPDDQRRRLAGKSHTVPAAGHPRQGMEARPALFVACPSLSQPAERPRHCLLSFALSLRGNFGQRGERHALSFPSSLSL